VRPRLTAIVTTHNEEVNIQACLESLSFVDEVLLVDSFSTDRTLAVARAVPGVKMQIVQREYFGSAAQKNWAMDQVSTPWILVVDADERVPEALAKEIQAILEAGPRARHYFLRRQNFFLGRLIRHSGWSTDKVVRLFERGAARYPNRRVHADLTTHGATPTLTHPMIHETYRSLSQALEKLHRYATWAAADAYRAGRSPGIVELLIRHPGRVPGRPPRPGPLRLAGLRRVPEMGQGLGVGALRGEGMARRAALVRRVPADLGRRGRAVSGCSESSRRCGGGPRC
jgi:glycosyltransferase involved in cell wall biosynthesis